MSTGKETLLLVLALNLVLTVLVVGAALALLSPATPAAAPDDTAKLREALAAQDRQVEALRDRIAALELESEVQAGRIAALSRSPSTLPASAAPGEAPPAGEPAKAPDAPAPEAAMQKAFRDMVRQQARRARDRFMEELLNPTPESEARQERRLSRISDMVARTLELEPRDRDAVDRILREVDAGRRRSLRELAQQKSSPDDITYPEVEKVLEGSFAEEDRLIAEALPEDKADEYQKTAESFRQIILFGAQAAFPAEKEE